jgi:hypothetical protein
MKPASEGLLYDDLFCLVGLSSNRYLWLNVDEEWRDVKLVNALVRGEKQPSKPVVFSRHLGSQEADFLWCSWVGYIVVSQRVV